jgi:hypothetical protein
MDFPNICFREIEEIKGETEQVWINMWVCFLFTAISTFLHRDCVE